MEREREGEGEKKGRRRGRGRERWQELWSAVIHHFYLANMVRCLWITPASMVKC